MRRHGHVQAEKLAVISLHSVLSLLARVRQHCFSRSSLALTACCAQGDMRSSSLAVEGKSPNSRVVQYIAEAVQAQVRRLAACRVHRSDASRLCTSG